MGRLTAALYDRFMRTSEAACLAQWRAELLGDLAGQVLEVGAGTGLNLPHYPRTLSRLMLSEPDPYMRSTLAEKLRAQRWDQGEVLDGSLEALPHPAATFDAVVGTLVLCSVPRLDRALEEIYRVLRPGGRFVFLEHVAAEHRPRRLLWQHRIEPVWRRLAGNCHLTRHTGDAILATGFVIVQIKRESMRKALPVVRPTIRGVAVRPEQMSRHGTSVVFDSQPVLRGDLVELRPLQADDYGDLYAVAADRLIWEQHPVRDRHDPHVFRAFFRESIDSGGALIATDLQTGQVIGASRFQIHDTGRGEVEIGWTFLARSHWGGRYNGEMKRLMLGHAFQFVDRVVFLVGVDNLRSQRAMERIGAVRGGNRMDTGGHDSDVYEVTASAFASRQERQE